MNQPSITNSNGEGGPTLGSLRRLAPDRPLLLHEAQRIAELQANRLLRLTGQSDIPVPTEVIADLPRIRIEHDPDLPRQAASGASYWDSTCRSWVIAVNPEEPSRRRRFTVFHEFKHVIDHVHVGIAHPSLVAGLEPCEFIADYFAGCALMPRTVLKAAFFDGIQRVSDLAELFDVSPRAMTVRLRQLGLLRDHDEDRSIGPGPGGGPVRNLRLQRLPAPDASQYCFGAPS